MLRYTLFFVIVFVVTLILNLTLPFYNLDILEILVFSMVITFINWLVNLPASKKNKSGEE